MANWMLYGATGYTGILLAEEAVRRGHRPVLAGRSAQKLAPLARRVELDYAAFALDDISTAISAVAGFDLILHAAGPFIHTSAPMIQACLANGVHYLDITGEIAVFQHVFEQDAAARDKGICLIPGVGFDVVPSDCMAMYVAKQVEEPNTLETFIDAITNASAGTTKSILEIIAHTGNVIRRRGELVPIDLGWGARTFPMPHGESTGMPIPWGDLATAYRSTGIPNIISYFAVPPHEVMLAHWFGYFIQNAVKFQPLRRVANRVIDAYVSGPDETLLEEGRSYVYAKATNRYGNYAEAWLETLEAYKFTALSGIRSVEKTLELRPEGALTPALAFGADFVLEIEGTRRWDVLPELGR